MMSCTIVTPWLVKVYRTIFPSLYHFPSSICCLNITENTICTPFSSTPTLHLVNSWKFISKEVKIINITTGFNGNVIYGIILLNVVSHLLDVYALNYICISVCVYNFPQSMFIDGHCLSFLIFIVGQ